MRSSIYSVIVPLAVAFVITPVAAHAHGRGGACREDLKVLCPNVTPGPGAFRSCLQTICPDVTPGPGSFESCLQQHNDQLSTACQEQLSRMQSKMAAWQQACGADVQSKCSTATGQRDVFKCLHDNRDQLSQACQDFLATHRHRRHHHGDHPCEYTPTPGVES